jgi:hypothetical protein
MGNYCGKCTDVKYFEKQKCSHCNELIGKQKWVICVRCNILLHSTCEIIVRGDNKFSQCPNCYKYGTIGGYMHNITDVPDVPDMV